MAKYHYPILLVSFLLTGSAFSSSCSTVPTDADKEIHCAGEEGAAKDLCMETLKVKRDDYGRVVEHSYKVSARTKISDDAVQAVCVNNPKEQIEDCKKTFRLSLGLDGDAYGYSYEVNGERYYVKEKDDKGKELAPPETADGSYFCRGEAYDNGSKFIETASYRKCVEELNAEMDGDYVVSYMRTSVSSFPSDAEAKDVCSKFEFQSKEYSFCKENVPVLRDKDGKVMMPLVSLNDLKIPADFVPLAPVCAQQKRETKPISSGVATQRPSKPEESTSVSFGMGRAPSQKSSPCADLKGKEYNKCMDERMGEVTVVGFEGCKAVWDSLGKVQKESEASKAPRTPGPGGVTKE